jgi:hypothetical protein
MDATIHPAYMTALMTRLLLTLLALLTGLVAQVSPAQTIMRGGDAEIGVSLDAVGAERRAAPVAHPSEVGSQPGPQDARCTILMAKPQRDCLPATYIVGVDRALE